MLRQREIATTFYVVATPEEEWDPFMDVPRLFPGIEQRLSCGFDAEFLSPEPDRCEVRVRTKREWYRDDSPMVAAAEEWFDEANVDRAEVRSDGCSRSLAARAAIVTGPWSRQADGPARRYSSRNSLPSSGVASGLGELPPSQWKPITGHKAVYVRSVAADRYARSDRVCRTGDAHHWNEESNCAQPSLDRDSVRHCISSERIGSTPSVSVEADEIKGWRQLAASANNYEMEVDEP